MPPSNAGPKVFGREMVESRGDKWSLKIDGETWAEVYRGSHSGSLWYFSIGPVNSCAFPKGGWYNSRDEALAALMAYVKSTVESLGPLVGWAPKGGADAG